MGQKVRVGDRASSEQAQCARNRPEWEISMAKLIMVLASSYVLYIGATCPCRPNIYSCHLRELYIALACIVTVLVYFNGARVHSY